MTDSVVVQRLPAHILAGVIASALMLSAGAARAEDLPAIRTTAKNAVAACATPGRLMAYLKARTPELDRKFEAVAVDYMRHGTQLGVRWDYAFFQMIVETGGLTFKNGNRSGDVKPTQFNLAGLGATGNGEPGETFPDLSTGVRAHLEHVLMYAGAKVESPVAERTRKVQEWGVLTSWHKGFKRPITFADLASKWAPKSKSYSDSLESVADKFFDETCKQADPHPEFVAEARGEPAIGIAKVADAKPAKPASVDLAKKAIEDGKADGQDARLGLGATAVAKAGDQIVKILNEKADVATPAEDQPQKIAAVSPMATKPPQADKAVTQVSAAAGAAKAVIAAPTTVAQKCRVWTASYGGQKSVIVRSIIEGVINFTVLDVNEGQEAREADAFISAYAKGGQVAGEFPAQAAALDKAFELCPEG
jgi:hypothetical protein